MSVECVYLFMSMDGSRVPRGNAPVHGGGDPVH